MKMKSFVPCITTAVALFTTFALAANSFAGSNLYYAAGLSSATRGTLLDALQGTGVKVLRVWLDGQSQSQKGTTIDPFPDLEPVTIGTYNDTVLERLDDFMIDAQAHGIKLLISMHSFNALQAGDIYGQIYGTGYFYEQTTPQQQFDARLEHVLNHVHTSLGKPWKQLSDYIFAFEASENEAMIGKGQQYIEDHQSWQCDRASMTKSVLGDNSDILVVTGGECWMDESVQPDCDALDVISIHAYGAGDFATSSIQTYLAISTRENDDCPTGGALDTNTRNSNIKTWASQIDAAGVPWLYWQIIPNADPHYGYDYEIGVGDASWSPFQAAALAAGQATAVFDYSEYLL
ncbi:glycoside hydrolase family 5 protein [Hydnomerulius pinastri MD-312]|uniref:Glycoside hydrolase family 5 protein n=1 Tax=Hydnomerulius pinastri MD-312 TaxID=994086 RepID=A0A0C9WCZ8_9AGAM|nr:glycoside hydrolase family 5 protein [Hydnomerulius pinastri MD-312]